MGKTEQLEAEWIPYLEEYLTSGKKDGLLGFTKSNSNLPGPRANPELADVLSEIIVESIVSIL